MYKTLIFCAFIGLFAAGCAGTTIDEKFDLAMACDAVNQVPSVKKGVVQVDEQGEVRTVTTEGACDEEWSALDRAEQRKIDKERWEAQFKCPKGQVFWCDGSRWCESSNRHRQFEVTSAERAGSGCVSRDAAMEVVRRALGQW